ncbi:LysM domain-containing protein [Verrucomicrobium sp. GAS474]|uniref:LysM peptidoglycan-binding domain-containing protein n=1 Tax=Verrucomicrobium sp. GAS474 TaxID=1882831 RepID=UPI00087D59C9|nr:LysM domain-containing protein [Verrucomicrobium sp. GAS474]SDT91209.1 LysM domain-containing protein [Verrucomicrobium sp. GAS474]
MTPTPFPRRPFSLFLSLGAALGLVFLAAGCQKDEKTASAEDDTNPHFHAATLQIQQQNFAEAAKEYEAALRANPAVTEAHYELGLLYGDHLGQPIAALYHFNQYLLDRPNGDNSQQAQARLNAAAVGFAATVPNSPIQNAEVFAKLQKDNQDLQHSLGAANQRVNELLSKLASSVKSESGPAPDASSTSVPALKDATSVATAESTATSAAAAAAPAEPAPRAVAVTPSVSPAPIVGNPAAAPAPVTSPTAAGGQPYTIVSGDTLWKIAKQFYPGHVADGIAKIKAANTDVLAEGKPLKIGTQIRIP